jgi:hypothetical protein
MELLRREFCPVDSGGEYGETVEGSMESHAPVLCPCQIVMFSPADVEVKIVFISSLYLTRLHLQSSALSACSTER